MSKTARTTPSANATAIVASSAAATLTLVVCASVLRLDSLWPFHVGPRMDVIAAAAGTWGASWEHLSQPADAIQRDALIALARTVLQLGVGGVLIAILSLTLHTVSRIFRAWRGLAVRCALGAPLRSLLWLVGRELGVFGALGWVLGVLGGGAIVAALNATWPVILTRPAQLIPILTAAGASLLLLGAILFAITFLLLYALHRGLVRSIAQLHGEHVTPSGALIFAQQAAAAVQLAALLVVTYGATLLLRNSTLFEPDNAQLVATNATGIAPLTWIGPSADSTRARSRALGPVIAALGEHGAVSSPDAQLGLGRRIRMLGLCGQCFIGLALQPLNLSRVRMIAVEPQTTGVRTRGRAGARDFAASDTLGSPLVAIINQAAAFELFPGGNPIGKEVRLNLELTGGYRVIGIERTTSPRGLGNRGNEPPIVYVSALQHPPTVGELSGPRSVWDTLVALVTTAAPDATATQPAIGAARLLSDRLEEFAAPLDWFAGICIGLATTATGIASYSLAAVMNQIIRIRERDIAIRVALGASPKDVERWVTRQTVAITVAGVTIGLSAARWIGTLLREKAIQSAEGDLALLGAMVLVFGGLGIVASWWPARKAARIQPAVIWAKVT